MIFYNFNNFKPAHRKMNEINYPTEDTQGPFIDYKHSFRSYRSVGDPPLSNQSHVHPLRRRTRMAIFCWSSILIFAVGCLVVGVLAIILLPGHGIETGIPLLIVGGACLGASIFCFYTIFSVPECHLPEGHIFPESSRGEDCEKDTSYMERHSDLRTCGKSQSDSQMSSDKQALKMEVQG